MLSVFAFEYESVCVLLGYSGAVFFCCTATAFGLSWYLHQGTPPFSVPCHGQCRKAVEDWSKCDLPKRKGHVYGVERALSPVSITRKRTYTVHTLNPQADFFCPKQTLAARHFFTKSWLGDFLKPQEAATKTAKLYLALGKT